MSHNRRSRKLFDALTNFDGELQNALFTTYNFEARYFEGILLPKLLDVRVDEEEDARLVAIDMVHKLKQKEIFVIADGRINKTVKKGLFGYHLLPVFEATQHAKIFILQFEDSFRLTLGSANLTESGIHRNKEVYAEFDLNSSSSDWNIFFDVLTYLEGMAEGMNPNLSTLLRAWRRQADLLAQDFKPELPLKTKFVGITPTKGKLSFRPLLDGFLDRHGIEEVGGRRVDQLLVMSPFFESENEKNSDPSKTLLYSEYYDLKGDHRMYPQVCIYLPSQGENILCLFPQNSYGRMCDEIGENFVALRNPQVVMEGNREVIRFPHGKLYVVRNHKGFMMTVIGSSNFSRSGFGSRTKGQNNWEANLAFFTAFSEPKDLKSIFPKDEVIDDEYWQNAGLEDGNPESNPDNHVDDLIVLSDAKFVEGKLLLHAALANPADFRYFIAESEAKPVWSGSTGTLYHFQVKGVSVEVRDKDSVVIQDIPIQFVDDSYSPLEMEVSKQEFSDWIEARYLYSRHMPLSVLLERFGRKSSVRAESQKLRSVTTDEYLMYRVKTFNNLVSKIFEVLRTTKNYPKRVRYHLIGDFGLLKCIEGYLDHIQEDDQVEVFCIYQAVEVVSSVLSAFESDMNSDTREVVQQFWDEFKSKASGLELKSGARQQLNSYMTSLDQLAVAVLSEHLESPEVQDVAV